MKIKINTTNKDTTNKDTTNKDTTNKDTTNKKSCKLLLEPSELILLIDSLTHEIQKINMEIEELKIDKTDESVPEVKKLKRNQSLKETLESTERETKDFNKVDINTMETAVGSYYSTIKAKLDKATEEKFVTLRDDLDEILYQI